MKKVYFAGSITGGRDFVDNYRAIIEYLKKDFNVLTEHLGDKNINSNGEIEKTPEYIFTRDCEWILDADFIVADVSNPSLGVGYEIGLAESIGKPILCLYKKSDRRVSSMITGNQYLTVYGYDTIDEAKEIIDEYVNNIN